MQQIKECGSTRLQQAKMLRFHDNVHGDAFMSMHHNRLMYIELSGAYYQAERSGWPTDPYIRASVRAVREPKSSPKKPGYPKRKSKKETEGEMNETGLATWESGA